MITPIIRVSQALEEIKRAHAEIEAEDLRCINRFHQSKALQYTALAEEFAALSVKHLQKINVDRTVSPIRKRRTHVASNAA